MVSLPYLLIEWYFHASYPYQSIMNATVESITAAGHFTVIYFMHLSDVCEP
jgi:hypothetical protein